MTTQSGSYPMTNNVLARYQNKGIVHHCPRCGKSFIVHDKVHVTRKMCIMKNVMKQQSLMSQMRKRK